MEASKLIKVTSVSAIQKDKNSNEYKVIGLSTPEEKLVVNAFNNKGAIVKAKVKTSSFVTFAHSYLLLSALAKEKGVEIKALDKKDTKDIKADFGYDLQLGDQVEGDIVTRKVEAYDIPDRSTGEMRIVDFYTCPVLGSTEDAGFEQIIEQTFKGNNHKIYSNKLEMVPIAVKKSEKTAQETFSELEEG